MANALNSDLEGVDDVEEDGEVWCDLLDNAGFQLVMFGLVLLCILAKILRLGPPQMLIDIYGLKN